MWIPPSKSSNGFSNLPCPFHSYPLSQASPGWIPLSSMTVFLLFYYVQSPPTTYLSTPLVYLSVFPLIFNSQPLLPKLPQQCFSNYPSKSSGFSLKPFPNNIKYLRGEGMGSRSSWTSGSLFSLLPTRPAGLLSVSLVFQWHWLNISVPEVWKLGLAFFRLAFSLAPTYLSGLTLKGTSPGVPKAHSARQCSCPWMVPSHCQSVHLSPLCWNSIGLPWLHSSIITSGKPALTPAWEILSVLCVSVPFSNIPTPFHTVL